MQEGYGNHSGAYTNTSAHTTDAVRMPEVTEVITELTNDSQRLLEVLSKVRERYGRAQCERAPEVESNQVGNSQRGFTSPLALDINQVRCNVQSALDGLHDMLRRCEL